MNPMLQTPSRNAVHTLVPRAAGWPLWRGTVLTVLAALASAAALAQPVPEAAGRHGGMHRDMPRSAMPGTPGEGHAHRAMLVRPGGPGMAGMLSERLLDKVGASAEQKAQVRSIVSAARQELHAQHGAARQLHEQLATLLASPQVDAAAAEGLRQKLVAQHDVTSKRMLQGRLDALAVLTPEQRQKWAEHLAQSRQMRERHHQERKALHGPHS